MRDISQIDLNFKVETQLARDDIRFYDARSFPFGLYGVFYENGQFRRMPEEAARRVNDGVYALHTNTAGGRVRFRTNSPYIAINAKMPQIGRMPHFALCGSAGFDLYVDHIYYASFVPPFNLKEGYEKLIGFATEEMREITIHFPLYSQVSALYIGLQNTASVEAPTSYMLDTPIVFYGSSITQGGCASRPGNAYQGFVSRALDADFINLGFSGSARGELSLADYINTLSMSAFVYDYDHNAPTVEHLARTHEKLFRAIRAKHTALPIVILSRPKYRYTEEELCRLAVIKRTYENAVTKGDGNVYFLDGRELMAFAENEGTVDGCHPNDLGFFSMAQALIALLKTIL